MRSIDIDLEVHRAIENARTDFGQSQNAILRILLGIDGKVTPLGRAPKPRLPRSSGAYSIVIGGAPIEANTLKELLRRAVLFLAKSRPRYLDTLSRYESKRGRRIIARSPEGLYPKSPHLAGLAERLDGEWWFDTNVSRGQVEAYLKVLCEIARVPAVPRINKRSTKTELTLADLGLE